MRCQISCNSCWNKGLSSIVTAHGWLQQYSFERSQGNIHLRVDYRAPNKRASQDAYPLPLPDDVQDQLASSIILSTLDLRCRYWQVPVHPNEQAKTAFSPGPGMAYMSFAACLLGWQRHHGHFSD